MATVIVSSSVWTRIYEFYDNVENRYRNTWDINDTLEQINKIKWVIQNFEGNYNFVGTTFRITI